LRFICKSHQKLQEDPLLQRAQRVRRAKLMYFITFLGKKSVDDQSTTFTYNWPRNATGFGEITQNNGHYAVHGHSRSSISVPIKSPYATFY